MGMVPFDKWSKRGVWGSVNARAKKLEAVVVHHSAGSNVNRDSLAQVRHIESVQFNRKRKDGRHTWGTVAYNYVIATDGTVFEGRGLRFGNAANRSKTGPYGNSNTLSVCFSGDWGTKGPASLGATLEPLHKSQLGRMWKSLAELLPTLEPDLSAGAKVLGHRDVSATDCPGDHLYSQVLTPLAPLVTTATTVEDPDELMTRAMVVELVERLLPGSER